MKTIWNLYWPRVVIVSLSCHKGGVIMYKNIINQLRNTESRSKRKMLDEAADIIEAQQIEIDITIRIISKEKISYHCLWCFTWNVCLTAWYEVQFILSSVLFCFFAFTLGFLLKEERHLVSVCKKKHNGQKWWRFFLKGKLILINHDKITLIHHFFNIHFIKKWIKYTSIEEK